MTFFNDLNRPLNQFSMSRHFFEVEYRKKRRVLKTKLYNIAREDYGMVPCFVTLTDLWTRRTGLSASAELLVCLYTHTKLAPVSIYNKRWYYIWHVDIRKVLPKLYNRSLYDLVTNKIAFYTSEHYSANKMKLFCRQSNSTTRSPLLLT